MGPGKGGTTARHRPRAHRGSLTSYFFMQLSTSACVSCVE